MVIHPQSLVHSMVEFVDGSTLAQASPPDMTLPIALALGWPDRIPGAAAALDWSQTSAWEFLPLDHEAFPAVALCREAGRRGGTAPAALNAANEECVRAFEVGALPFLGIVDTLARLLDEHDREHGEGGNRNTTTLADVLGSEHWARARARELIGHATARVAADWSGRSGRLVSVNWLYLLGVLVFVVGLLVAIGLHEVGHMVPAKRFGVRVTQYMIGFGPTAWSRKIGRHRVRHQVDPARRLHPHDRDVPARQGRQDPQLLDGTDPLDDRRGTVRVVARGRARTTRTGSSTASCGGRRSSSWSAGRS